jgi:hypothetical protein
MTTNWNSILTTKRSFSTVSKFASGKISGKEFSSSFANTPSSGTVNTLLKSHGVEKARVLAQKALSRR